MAERNVSGKDVLLFIDPAGGTTYDLIVCLTANSKKIATSVVDAASKCGPSSTPGPTTVTIDFAGQIMVEPGASRLSEGALHDLIMAGTTIGWKISPAIPVNGDDLYSGKGFFASLDTNWDLNGATFSGSIGIKGTPHHSVYPGS